MKKLPIQSTESSAGSLYRCRAFKLIPGIAGGALSIPAMPLKDRLSFVLNAGRAKVMHGFIAGSRFFQTVHNRTGWRLPKFVALKLGLKSLLLCERLLECRELELQIRVRHLRVCYLHSQLAQRRFNLGICRHLRSLEKPFDSLDCLTDLRGCRSGLPGQIQHGIETIEIEIHGYLQFKKAFQERQSQLQRSGSILQSLDGFELCKKSNS